MAALLTDVVSFPQVKILYTIVDSGGSWLEIVLYLL